MLIVTHGGLIPSVALNHEKCVWPGMNVSLESGFAWFLPRSSGTGLGSYFYVNSPDTGFKTTWVV